MNGRFDLDDCDSVHFDFIVMKYYVRLQYNAAAEHDSQSFQRRFTMGSKTALQKLKDGNARFVSGNAVHPGQDAARRKDTVANGQHPFAVILCCSDSRCPPEIVFDQGIGDIFIVRVAGNIAGPMELASIEYGTEHLNAPLLVVLGHSSCGAVTAAATNAKTEGHIPRLLECLVAPVNAAREKYPGVDGSTLVPHAIEANVRHTMAGILQESEVVKHLVKEEKLLVVGGIHDLESGKVLFLGGTP
jgi:carbonic anhydrase